MGGAGASGDRLGASDGISQLDAGKDSESGLKKQRNWSEIEADYVISGSSYRNLAKKYGISLRSVEIHGKQGGWVEKRQRHKEDVMEKILEEETRRTAQRTARLMEVGDGLLDKVQELTAETESPAALKTLTEALKNIRDAQMLKESARAEAERITVVLDSVSGFTA